jgi:hypothetical protein
MSTRAVLSSLPFVFSIAITAGLEAQASPQASPMVSAPTATLPTASATAVQQVTAAPGTVPKYALTIQWVGSTSPPQTITDVTSVSNGTTATVETGAMARADEPRQRRGGVVAVSFAGVDATIDRWHAALVEGRPLRADLTLTVAAPSGKIAERFIYRNAIMSSWDVVMMNAGARPSYRASFTYETMQWTAQ